MDNLFEVIEKGDDIDIEFILTNNPCEVFPSPFE